MSGDSHIPLSESVGVRITAADEKRDPYVDNIINPAAGLKDSDYSYVRGQIQFEPGGKHLMMMAPKKHYTKGQEVNMTLTFKSGKKQVVSVKVAAR